MLTQRNFKYRIYPSKKQVDKLNKTLFDSAIVYNNLLNACKCEYMNNKKSLSQFDMNKLVKELDIGIYSQVKQEICKRVSLAYKSFFRRVKNKKEKAGFPRFKSLNRYKSITYPQTGFKFLSEKRLFVSKVGSIPIVLDRVPKGKLKTFTIKKTSIGWFAIFSCSEVPIEQFEAEDNNVGIDVGIESFAVLSNGERIENPKFLIKSERKLARLQRKLSKKKKGSSNRKKARIKVARLHEKIFNQRQDFLHKQSSILVKKFKNISVEKLKIQNMVKNHYLARSINDASWGYFVQMLCYKVERTNGRVIKVNPKNTSKTCSKCGNIQDMPLAKREFKCLNCGFVCHRDLNAAINIDTAGLAEFEACGLESKEEAGTINKLE